jgi:hypothetical protein
MALAKESGQNKNASPLNHLKNIWKVRERKKGKAVAFLARAARIEFFGTCQNHATS